MNEIVTSLSIIVGLVFVLGGSLGIVRLKDAYGRMHATGLTGTLGILFFMLAAVVYFGGHDGRYAVKMLLLAAFIFLVSPVATHMMTRAAYFTGVKMWPGSVLDEYAQKNPPKGEEPKNQ